MVDVTDGLRVVPPNVCTLVGPTKHYLAFDRAGFVLGKRGWLVFSVGSHRAGDVELKTDDDDRKIYWHTHRQKIGISSLVFVVDLPDTFDVHKPYIGDDTKAEIQYAHHIGVPVQYMSQSWHGGRTINGVHTYTPVPWAPGYGARPRVGVSGRGPLTLPAIFPPDRGPLNDQSPKAVAGRPRPVPRVPDKQDHSL